MSRNSPLLRGVPRVTEAGCFIYMSNDLRVPYNSKLKEIARQLRKNGTMTEAMVWKYIKNKQLGVDFNRQKPLADYIVDFYCIPLRLAIEIDGSSHELKDDYDYKREQDLKRFNIRILRFTDKQVKENLEGVISSIKKSIQNTPSSAADAESTPLKRGEV